MKIMVTGGAGFIGANFILYWLKKYPDDTIVNYDVLTYAGNLKNLVSVENLPNYKFVRGNICDQSLVDSTIKNNSIETIVHFAAETHVDRSIANASPFVKTNVEGTYVLLQAAVNNKIRHFHHISTDEVFGHLELGSNLKFTINSPYSPRSPYSASKAGADHLVRAYHSTYQLPITISNCSNNFGPYHYPEKFIPLAITNLLQDKKVPVYGDGLNVRDWLYVEDHCRAIDLILKNGEVGKTYLVGGLTEDISNLAVVKKICAMMNKDETMIEFVDDRLGHDRRYAIDWSKTKEEIGWEPTHTFDQALQLTIDWFTENESWWKEKKI